MSTQLKVHPVDRCPACGNEQSQPIPVGNPALRRCSKCALVHAPQYADPSDVYIEGYLFGDTSFGLDVMHPLFQQYLTHAASIRMRLIEKFIGPDAHILDVGCGTGEVLAVARERGWRTTGVEPVVQSASYAQNERGLDVIPALLEESGLPQRSFDVVTAFHVVEHMTDAVSFLKTISRWAKPGGYVAVEVPNWHSLHRRNAGDNWTGLRPLEHIGHYSPATLKSTFERSGLTPKVIRTPGFLWSKQTLEQQFDDLGLYRWKPQARRIGRYQADLDQPARFGRRCTSSALVGLQMVYDRLGIGQVIFAVGQVSASS